VGSSTAGSLGCLDMDGNPIDWWFIYKANDGFNFAYRDSSDTSTKALQMTDKFLNVTKELALGSTLHQLYLAKDKLSFAAYNDEAPRGEGKTRSSASGGAHAKGILAAQSDGGFWLVHSVPKFPNLNASQFRYDTSDIYGQTFLCMSLDKQGIEDAAYQISHFHPDIYDSNYNSDHKLTNMSALISGTRYEGSNVLTVNAGNSVMTSFAKSNKWGKDLYEDLVEPYFRSGFMWETWRRSPAMKTYCKPDYTYDSVNVNQITFPDSPKFTWKYTKDHAKWGLCQNSQVPVVCVGGINRMTSQRKRGGGTVCIKDANFYASMSAIIAQTDKC